MNIPLPVASYVLSVITSPSEPFTPYEESDASSAANVTSYDISKYIQL
jgi:hypothetical protein